MFLDESRTKRIFGSDNTMGLFVALYLILLAFFIVLTSVSQHAASRSAAAMESVNKTFLESGKNERTTIDPSAQDAASNDAMLQSVQRAFFAEFELSGRFSTDGGNVFEIQFPEDLLFPPGSFRVRPNMQPFLDQLVGALRSDTQSRKQEMVLLFGTGVGPVDAEMTRSQEVAVRRAGSLARYLRDHGLTDGVFTTGFVGIPEGDVLAVFRNRAMIDFAPPTSGEGG